MLKEFKNRKTLGFNFDPSHLLWQGISPHIFLRDFASRIYHVHMKDEWTRRDGAAWVDGVTAAEYERGLGEKLQNLVEL